MTRSDEDVQLRACPFDGGPASIGTVRYTERMVRAQQWSQDTFYFASCVTCGTSNVGLTGHMTPQKAAAAWNRRVADGGSHAE